MANVNESIDAKSTAPLRIVSIVSAALILRLAVVGFTAKTHTADWFFAQATELARLGESLHAGLGLSSPFGGSTGPSAFLSPGYPAIVAAVFAAFHPYSFASALVLMLLQAIFGAATVLVLMLLTMRIFGVTAANLAGAIWALSPPAIFLPTLFWETSLSVLLATTIAALALYLADHSESLTWTALGVTSAAALTVNPALLPIVVCCIGWTVIRKRAQLGSASILGLSLLVALSSPWPIRNAIELHAFVPFRSNLGYELWQGNRPGSDGFFEPALHPNVNREEFQRYETLGEIGYMRDKSSLAKASIAENPRGFAALTMKRVFDFWTGIVRHSSSLIVAYIVLTSLLGFAGLTILWRKNKSLALFFLLPFILFPLPYYITHPDFRFRLVIDPLLAALSAYAVTSWRD
jgi:4-amino-4-deoxy-L-arabinose transferase-like glycosyltransferase